MSYMSISTWTNEEVVKERAEYYKNGYNDAINDFAKMLKSDKFQKYNLDMVFETSRDLSYSDCIDAFIEYVDVIADQLKQTK